MNNINDIWVLEKELIDVIDRYQKEIEELQDSAQLEANSLAGVRGNIKVGKSNGCHQYRIRETDESGKSSVRYLNMSDINIARLIIQRDFSSELSNNCKRTIRMLAGLQRQLNNGGVISTVKKISEGRRALANCYVSTDEEFIENWINKEYSGKGFDEVSSEIYTEKGERVRSKSEKIIADKLYMLNIPYKYECPLILRNNKVFYPDFTVLDVRKRKEIYWEHLGMMDNDEYSSAAFNKIVTYERNGIFPGKNLIITHETSTNPLDTRLLNLIIREYLNIS